MSVVPDRGLSGDSFRRLAAAFFGEALPVKRPAPNRCCRAGGPSEGRRGCGSCVQKGGPVMRSIFFGCIALVSAVAGAAPGEEEKTFTDLFGREPDGECVHSAVGWTDMHYAAALDLRRTILEFWKSGASPLESSGKIFDESLAKRLHGLGAEPTFSGWKADGQTPAMVAAYTNSVEALFALRPTWRTPNIDAGDYFGRTALHYAVMGNAVEAMNYLVEEAAVKDGAGLYYGADFYAIDRHGDGILHYAAAHNALEAAKEIVRRGGFDVDVRQGAPGPVAGGDFGSICGYPRLAECAATPLHRAAENDAVEVSEWLVDHGADIEARDGNGATPLLLAAGGNAVSVWEFLVRRGAKIGSTNEDGDVFIKDDHGAGPLHYAALGNAVEIWKKLVLSGANVKAENVFGVLKHAARGAAWDIWRRIVKDDVGIDYFKGAEAGSGRSLLERAAESNALVIVKWLHGKGVEVEGGDPTLLHYAARGNAVDVAKWLLDRGAEVDAKAGDENYTPLYDAADNDARDVAELLVERGASISYPHPVENRTARWLRGVAWCNSDPRLCRSGPPTCPTRG